MSNLIDSFTNISGEAQTGVIGIGGTERVRLKITLSRQRRHQHTPPSHSSGMSEQEAAIILGCVMMQRKMKLSLRMIYDEGAPSR